MKSILKNEIYLVHQYISVLYCGTLKFRTLKFKLLRNKTWKYICLYVVKSYKHVLVPLLKELLSNFFLHF